MAGELPAYTAWLRTLPCRRCGCHGVHVHHRTGAGMGLRAHDLDGMPLCAACHRHLHALSGVFAAWSGGDLRTWEARQVGALQMMAPEHVWHAAERAPVDDEEDFF